MPSKAFHVWKLSEVEAYLEQYSSDVLSLDLVNTHKDKGYLRRDHSSQVIQHGVVKRRDSTSVLIRVNVCEFFSLF